MTEKMASPKKRTFWSYACCTVLLLLALILGNHVAGRVFPNNGTTFVWPQSSMDVRYDTIVLSLMCLCSVGIWFSWRGSRVTAIVGLVCGLLALATIIGVFAILFVSGDQPAGWH